MNVGDILIDFPLLREQYEFLISKYQRDEDVIHDQGTLMDNYDRDMWEGVLNLFETILEFKQ